MRNKHKIQAQFNRQFHIPTMVKGSLKMQSSLNIEHSCGCPILPHVNIFVKKGEKYFRL